MKKILFLSLILFCLPFLAGAQTKEYSYDSIEVKIEINQDSTFKVFEKQTYRLNGSFGYFYRDIQLKDLDHLSDIKVYDNKGRELTKDEYELSYQNGARHIQWNFPRQNFNNQLKSWTIEYIVHGALKFFEDYDELYWNAIFADREVIVQKSEIQVILPEKIEKKSIQAWAYLGKAKEKYQTNNYQIEDGQVRFWEDNILPGQFLTISVIWPKGIIGKPLLYRNQLINWLFLLLAALLPIFVFIKSFRTWQKKGKDPQLKKSIIAQYQPPENLSPGIVELLVYQKFSTKAVTAILVDLAVRGYLRIKERDKKWYKQQEYVFERLKTGNDLKSFEKIIFKGIFQVLPKSLLNIFKKDKPLKESVSTNDLKNNFYKHLPKIKKQLHQELTKTGYVVNNINKTRSKYTLFYIPFLAFSFIGGISGIVLSSLGIPFGIGLIAFSVGLLIAGAIGLIIARHMPSLTPEGAGQKWYWLGFKEYLYTAERFRLGAETPETFSKYLPYAIIFGVEKEWADRFANLKYQQPDWYLPVRATGFSGTGTSGQSVSFGNIAAGIASFSSSISSTFSSSPGSSGAGGGGSAGGGSGGGGGGAG